MPRLGLVAVAAALASAACTLLPIEIAVTAEVVDGASSAGLNAQTLDLGAVVVTSYEVTFHRIEVGNSEEDKFTLWEDSDGVTQDLVGAVSFDNVLPATWGTYQFMRLTIAPDIDLAGEVLGVPGQASVTVTGHSQDADGLPRFLFGTEAVNESGKFLLASPIEIRTGGSIALSFDLEGTVTVSPLTVTAPVITLEVL